MNHTVLVHFQKTDPLMYRLALQFPKIDLVRSDDYFVDLVEAIISQQLSEKAGATIVKRFHELFLKGGASPKRVLALSDQKIRDVGCSWSKVSYIKNIAKAFTDGTIAVDKLATWSDEQVIKHLTRIKGVGQWTAEMFLMFTLGREDVFSTADVGLQRAIKSIYKLKTDPTRQKLIQISDKWAPYRSFACRLLWKSLDNEV